MKTLERLFMMDKAVHRPIDIRSRNFKELPKRRGGQIVRSAVSALRSGGATRFYDAVAEALELLDHETGRRAVLALTDGEDTFSRSADLE